MNNRGGKKIVFGLAATIIGIPAGIMFLTIARYGGPWHTWALGGFAFGIGLRGLYILMFGLRGKPGKLFRPKRDVPPSGRDD